MSFKKDAPASANNARDDDDDDSDNVITSLIKKNEEATTTIETIDNEHFHKEDDDEEVIETTQDREIGRKYAINDTGNERDDNIKAKAAKRARKSVSNDKKSGANGRKSTDKPVVAMSHNQKYKNEELDYFLDLLEEILPSAPDEWDYLVKKYNAKFIDLPRSYSNLRKKYNYMSKESIAITDPDIPKSILRAKLVRKAVVEKCGAEIRYNIPRDDNNDDVLVLPIDNNNDDVHHAPTTNPIVDTASKAEDTTIGIGEMNSPKPSHINFMNNHNIDSNENNNNYASRNNNNMDTNEIMNYIIIQDQLQSRKQDEFYRKEKKRKSKEKKKEKKIRKKQKKELKRMKKRERIERKRHKHQKYKDAVMAMEREQRFQDNFNKQLMLMAMLFGKKTSTDIDMNQIASLFGGGANANNAEARPQVPGYSTTNDGISEDTTDDSSDDSSTTSSSSSESSSAALSDNDSNKKKRAKKRKKVSSSNKAAAHDHNASTTVTTQNDNNNKIDLTDNNRDENRAHGDKEEEVEVIEVTTGEVNGNNKLDETAFY